jgi:hypothetical protein
MSGSYLVVTEINSEFSGPEKTQYNSIAEI